jgi:hypothetical protein
MLDCIKEYIVLILSLPSRTTPIFNLKAMLENNINMQSNNEKYIDNISTINSYKFENVYTHYIEQSLKLEKKYHLSLTDIGKDLFAICQTFIMQFILD